MKNSWTGGSAALNLEEVAEENLALAVHRCVSGAFDRLVERFEGPLFNYAHGILQNAFDAQDVVQDAMLRAHKALTKQYGEAQTETLVLRPWLFRMVRNLCLNKHRTKSRRREQPIEEFDDGRIGPFHTSPEVERREDAELLRGAMAHLPVEARELIVLRFMEEMSYADMAKTVGTSEAALRGKVFRSLKLLREALEKKGVAYAV
ncbi:MAG TPA: RNA polymerase sigma factor [Thermoanaerobaculia bacterium]|nr:RNA polymerase sigma factor [Thermoanaerobaculia bacterium]